MSSLLKDIYSKAFYNNLGDILSDTVPGFNKQQFIRQIFDKNFKNRELKERMRHTTETLHCFFPADYAHTVKLIKKIISGIRKDPFTEDNLAFMFFPDYIERYGLDEFEHSVKAIEFVTGFVSCEFAVRPFILKYGDRMIRQMYTWSLHENHKVRRLSSEGIRPRLPWAMALPVLKKDPSPIFPVLENLKNDPHEWVRRSVANNLNDIAKDHPDAVIRIARKWKGISKETDAVIKHGCRTLLKQGHPEILKYYQLDHRDIALPEFTISTPQVRTGTHLEFSFSFVNNSKRPQTIRLEYAVHYKRQSGALSKKVFKISEKIYPAGARTTVIRRQSFKPITTRKFYTGTHQLSVIINGREMSMAAFELI